MAKLFYESGLRHRAMYRSLPLISYSTFYEWYATLIGKRILNLCGHLQVEESWTALISRGALVQAAPHIEDQVYKINAAFNQYHKIGKLVTGKKFHKRTCDFIMRQSECKSVNKVPCGASY